MDRDALDQRFRVDVGSAGGGRSFVRVVDTATGAERSQVGFNGESAEAIARRFASEILAEFPIKVSKIFGADIYRDGGSYSLGFYSDDEEWYEFFIPIIWEGDATVGYNTPVLYFNSVNHHRVLRDFTWDEAAEFLKPLSYDNHRFHELVEVVALRGCFPGS
jgi:hypothetical protein